MGVVRDRTPVDREDGCVMQRKIRDVMIVIQIRRGETYQSVGDYHEISKQRVWQIAAKSGVTRAKLRAEMK